MIALVKKQYIKFDYKSPREIINCDYMFNIFATANAAFCPSAAEETIPPA